MTANTSPIFTIAPKNSWTGNLTSGTNSYDGTSGVTALFTAGSNGSYVDKIVCEAAGSNVATVVRVFINNGSTNGTASNNSLYIQYSLPATTASSSAQTSHVEIPLKLVLAATYKLYVVIATSVSAGWQFTAVGGDY